MACCLLSGKIGTLDQVRDVFLFCCFTALALLPVPTYQHEKMFSKDVRVVKKYSAELLSLYTCGNVN